MIHLLRAGRLSKAIHSNLRDSQLETLEFSSEFQCNSGDWLIVALDTPRLDQLQSWERLAHERGARLFPVHVQNSEVVIGPATRPAEKGCLTCWEQRFYRGRGNARNYARLAIQQDQEWPDALLTAGAVAVVAQIAVQRFIQIDNRFNQALDAINQEIYYFDLRTFTGAPWKFVPDPTCSYCGALPDDSPERARLTFTARCKPSIHSDRLRPLSELDFLEEAFVGHFSNIVSNRKYRWPDHREAVTTVGVPLRESRAIEPCHGFCARYSDSDRAAILEAVERYCGAQPRSFLPSVFGSYAQFGDAAVNPRTFGLHSEREYKANPHITPYQDSLQYQQVWAYSFRQTRPALVPLDLGFYTSPQRPSAHRFIAVEGSSGCSIGNSIEEAILHGIFEVAERDAYMLVWYSRSTPACIDPSTSKDPESQHWCRRLNADGFELFVMDGTSDFGIPAVLIAAVRRERWPHVICSSGAHLDPEVAFKKALRELYATLGMHEAGGESRRQEAIALACDFSTVRELVHHSLAHSTLETLPHFDFLLSGKERISLDDMKMRVAGLRNWDLTHEMYGVVDKVLASGCDVLVVDQTAPEQEAYGLYTVKVLIPGAIPPCWGDHRRRFEHLPRLDAAVAESWSKSRLDQPAPNVIPHPFV